MTDGLAEMTAKRLHDLPVHQEPWAFHSWRRVALAPSCDRHPLSRQVHAWQSAFPIFHHHRTDGWFHRRVLEVTTV